jgi:hypothetical protein
VRIVFDMHNYYFPEERRRMRTLTNLLYEHYNVRAQYAALLSQLRQDVEAELSLPPDFRRQWDRSRDRA